MFSTYRFWCVEINIRPQLSMTMSVQFNSVSHFAISQLTSNFKINQVFVDINANNNNDVEKNSKFLCREYS